MPEILLSGVVVAGDRRGRELGFPTANVELDEASAPPPEDGVYAGWLEDESGHRHPAAVSVGGRPTYYGETGVRLVEAYLLDFDGDLYGTHVNVGIAVKVRGQERFETTEQLVVQMTEDVEKVRAWAAKAP